MEAARLRISERLRALMRYGKFSGEVPRILLFRSQYWVDGACEAAAKSMGWQVSSVLTPMEGAQTREQTAALLETLVHFRPDFIFSVNLAGMDVDGVWARFFDDLGVPHITWFVDNPRTIIMDKERYATPTTMVLTWEEGYEPYLRNIGFRHVYYLPLAADTAHFNAPPGSGWSHGPCFVGNSMTLFARRSMETVLQDEVLRSIAERAFAAGRVTRANLGIGLSAIVNPDELAILDSEQRRRLEMLFFLEGTRRLRSDMATGLASLVAVRGDEEWRDIAPSAGPPVNYFEELPSFYRECEINLNVTSIQMASAVNQRVFDCPAAGGFLITDNQSDMQRHFDADECVVYSSWEECAEKVRFYKAHPEARIDVINKARARILSGHTYAHRLRSIVGWAMQHFG